MLNYDSCALSWILLMSAQAIVLLKSLYTRCDVIAKKSGVSEAESIINFQLCIMNYAL